MKLSTVITALSVTLFTLSNLSAQENEPDVTFTPGTIKTMQVISVTPVCFVLTSANDKHYYFGVESKEEKQMKEILKNMGSEFIKN